MTGFQGQYPHTIESYAGADGETLVQMWTIHGLARHLGVEREWFYHRLRTGALCEPDVIRKPPYGHYLIRDDAALLGVLQPLVDSINVETMRAANLRASKGASPADAARSLWDKIKAK